MINIIDFIVVCGLFLLAIFLFLFENYKNTKLQNELKKYKLKEMERR